MKYSIIDGRLAEYDENKNVDAIVETVKYSKGEIPQINDKKKQDILNNIFTGTHSRFESYNDCDVICLNLIDIEKYVTEHIPVYVILEKNKISFYTTQPDYVEGMFRKIMHEPSQNITADCLLYHFMNKLVFGDLVHLEEIERKLSALETNAFSGCTDKTFSKQILNIKKHLMWIELYYEQLINLIADIIQNDNGFLCERTIKSFNMLDSKIDRLDAKTENLLNYASEIRNAYQAEVDLQLNKSMKVLTAITVIFLPLTLIVGWFGMNFQMPEYTYAYSYPILIGVCVAIVVGLIAFFKKNKWF